MVWLIDDLFEAVLSLGEYIGQAVQTIVEAIVYPLTCILSWLLNILTIIKDTFVSLVSTLWNTFNIMYDFVQSIISIMFIDSWTTLILLAVTIVFLLRIYYFLKDISIVGNKI